jgi:hypothetical protein
MFTVFEITSGDIETTKGSTEHLSHKRYHSLFIFMFQKSFSELVIKEETVE